MTADVCSPPLLCRFKQGTSSSSRRGGCEIVGTRFGLFSGRRGSPLFSSRVSNQPSHSQPPSQSGYALSLSGEDKIMCINKYITGCRYQSKTGCAAMWCGSCCTPELLWGSNCSAKGMCGFKVETDARRRRGTVCPFWQVPFRKAGVCLHPTQPPPSSFHALLY